MMRSRVWLHIVVLAILSGSQTVATASNTEKAGNAFTVLLPLAGLATATLKHDRQGQVQFLKSFTANAVVTFGLKAAIDKRRPDGSCCDSFPSGHTSLSFMSATFMHRRYGQAYAIPAYAAATFVGYSRVESDKHFVEDVVAGAVIGFVSSYFFTTHYRGVTVTPVARHNFVGINISKAW